MKFKLHSGIGHLNIQALQGSTSRERAQNVSQTVGTNDGSADM